MDGIYQHFRPEEASVIDSLNEVIVRAKDEYRPILTHFLNPRQHFIADVLIGRFDDVKLKTFGGFSGSERFLRVLNMKLLKKNFVLSGILRTSRQ